MIRGVATPGLPEQITMGTTMACCSLSCLLGKCEYHRAPLLDAGMEMGRVICASLSEDGSRLLLAVDCGIFYMTLAISKKSQMHLGPTENTSSELPEVGIRRVCECFAVSTFGECR